MAERSFSEMAKTWERPPVASFSSSPRVEPSRLWGEAPAVARVAALPVIPGVAAAAGAPTRVVCSSSTEVTIFLRATSHHSLAKMPWPLGFAPVKSVA